MIVLPTRRKLIRRRDALYELLVANIQCASIRQIEDTMRMIHIINNKLRTYFIRENEPKEVFVEEDENIDNKKKNPFTINTISQ